MKPGQVDTLASACRYLRKARRSLLAGEPGHAIYALGYARHELGLAIGNWSNRAPSVERVRGVVHETERLLIAAVAVRPVDPHAVVSVLVEVMRLLVTRDGQEIADDLILERARNGATALLGAFDVRARPVDVARSTGRNQASQRTNQATVVGDNPTLPKLPNDEGGNE